MDTECGAAALFLHDSAVVCAKVHAFAYVWRVHMAFVGECSCGAPRVFLQNGAVLYLECQFRFQPVKWTFYGSFGRLAVKPDALEFGPDKRGRLLSSRE